MIKYIHWPITATQARLSYSISDKFIFWSLIAWYAENKSSFSLVVLVSGQIVTIGNGMAEIDASCSVKLALTGLLRHSIQIFRIDEPHKQSDKPKAITHQNLHTHTQWINSEEINIWIKRVKRKKIPFGPMSPSFSEISNTMNCTVCTKFYEKQLYCLKNINYS